MKRALNHPSAARDMDSNRMLDTEEDLRGIAEIGTIVTRVGAGTERHQGPTEFHQQPHIPAEGVKGTWKVNHRANALDHSIKC